MRLQLFQLEPLVHRHGISDHVQIVVLKIYNPKPGFVLYESIGNGPFLWNCPVKALGAGRNGLDSELGNFALENLERAP